MLVKGRKVVGREEMGVHYAIGPHEDDVVIKKRLLTRTTTTRGEPPLKKLQKKFSAFALEIDKDADNYSDCERLYKAFLQEITTFELPLLKSKAVIDANLREKENFKELQEEINQQILQAQGDIDDLKKQLEESKTQRQHKEECEAIRRLIALQPPRSETQKKISGLEKEIAILEAENAAASRTLELRKKQFYLLLHVVEELQNTIDVEQRGLAENAAASRTLELRKKQFYLLLHVVEELQNTIDVEQRGLAEELRNAMEEQKIFTEDTNGSSEPMAVD